MSFDKTLVVLPALPVRVLSTARVVLTKKFTDGMQKYREEWGNPVAAFMQPTETSTSNLDEFEVDPADLPFGLEVISYKSPELGRKLAGHQLILCSLTPGQDHLSKLCRSVGTPCVFVSEYTLKTRFQITRAGTRNPVVSLSPVSQSGASCLGNPVQRLAHLRGLPLDQRQPFSFLRHKSG
jgi:colanic acid/amylovoran biosynthesis glycosyltransferase